MNWLTKIPRLHRWLALGAVAFLVACGFAADAVLVKWRSVQNPYWPAATQLLGKERSDVEAAFGPPSYVRSHEPERERSDVTVWVYCWSQIETEVHIGPDGRVLHVTASSL